MPIWPEVSKKIGDVSSMFQQLGMAQLQRKQQLQDLEKQLLLKQRIAQQAQQQDPQQQFLRQLLSQFVGGQPEVVQPERFTPEEFGQLPLQQIQQLQPSGGFTPGGGLPFRPKIAGAEGVEPITTPQVGRFGGRQFTPVPSISPTGGIGVRFERAPQAVLQQAIEKQRALQKVKAEREEKPTRWELEKEAYDEAFRRLGGSYMVGLDEESKIEYENLGDQIYQQYLTQYGYGKEPEAKPIIPKPKETGRVTVISPQGVRGDIPANQLQEALGAGYKQVR